MTEVQFQNRLVWARSKRGISQQQLAETAEIAPAQISRYEAGRATPRPQIVAKLATALNVDLEWMLSGHGVPSSDLPPYPGKIDRVGWMQIWIPSELYSQLKRSADSNNRALEVEAAIRLKRSLSTEKIPETVGMKELHAKVEELQRFIQSSLEQESQLPLDDPSLQAMDDGQLAVHDESPNSEDAPVRVVSPPKLQRDSSGPQRKVAVEKYEMKTKSNRGKDAGQPRTIPVEVRKKRTFIKRGDLPKS